MPSSPKGKVAEATADYQQDESPLEPNFDDRSKQGRDRRAGARSPSTAKTPRPGRSTPGPGRRNQDRKAVFRLKEPVDAGRRRRDRRFRSSRTTAAGTATIIRTTCWAGFAFRSPARPMAWRPTRCRGASARFWPFPAKPAHRRADRRSVRLLAHDGRRVEVAERALSKRCGANGPRARRRWSCNRATSRARRTCSSGAIFSSRPPPSPPACRPRCIRCPRRAADAADAGPLAGRSPQSDHGPGGGQSRVAGLFWHGHGGHERRFRHAKRAGQPSASCSTGWRASSWTAAGALKAAAPADRRVGHLPAVVAA